MSSISMRILYLWCACNHYRHCHGQGYTVWQSGWIAFGIFLANEIHFAWADNEDDDDDDDDFVNSSPLSRSLFSITRRWNSLLFMFKNEIYIFIVELRIKTRWLALYVYCIMSIASITCRAQNILVTLCLYYTDTGCISSRRLSIWRSSQECSMIIINNDMWACAV